MHALHELQIYGTFKSVNTIAESTKNLHHHMQHTHAFGTGQGLKRRELPDKSAANRDRKGDKAKSKATLVFCL